MAFLVLVQTIRKCVRVWSRAKHSNRQGNIYKQNLHSNTRRKILNQSTLYQINCDYVFIECCCFACSWIRFSGLRIHFNLLVRSSRQRRSQFLCRCQCRRHRCYVFHIDEVRLFQNLLWWWLLLLFLFGRFDSQLDLAGKQRVQCTNSSRLVFVYVLYSCDHCTCSWIALRATTPKRIRRIEMRFKRFYTFQFYIQSK